MWLSTPAVATLRPVPDSPGCAKEALTEEEDEEDEDEPQEGDLVMVLPDKTQLGTIVRLTNGVAEAVAGARNFSDHCVECVHVMRRRRLERD